MRNLRHVTLAMGVFALLCAPSFAQQRQGGGPGRGGMGLMGRMAGMQILNAPPVHQELGLSEEQIEKLEALATHLREEVMGKAQEFRELPAEERTSKMNELVGELDKQIHTQVKDILEPKQVERFEQIHIQVQGLQAFLSPIVTEKLGLSEDQKATAEAEITKIETMMREEFQANQGAAPEAMRAAFEKINAARKEALDKVKSALTETQKETWKEMTGKPFEMPFGGRGPGGPGGGRRPQGPPPQF